MIDRERDPRDDHEERDRERVLDARLEIERKKPERERGGGGRRHSRGARRRDAALYDFFT